MESKSILLQLKILSNYMGRTMPHCDGFELSQPQVLVIGYLIDRQGEDVFPRDIEKEFNIRRSSANSLINGLEKQGYIKRESVKYDARLRKLVLLSRALELKAQIEEHVEMIESKMTQGLSQNQLKELREIINIMKDNLEKE